MSPSKQSMCIVLSVVAPFPPVWNKIILWIRTVKDLFALDPRLKHMCVNAQRIAGQDDEVSVLAGFERTDSLVEVEHYRVRHRQCIQSLFARHAGTDSHSGRCGGTNANP